MKTNLSHEANLHPDGSAVPMGKRESRGSYFVAFHNITIDAGLPPH